MERALKIGAVGMASALAFFAGKHFQEEKASVLTASADRELMGRNSHTSSTVTPPFRLISYPHFRILYSTYHRSPLSVHEILTKQLIEGDAPRAKFFFPEEAIKEKHLQVDQSFFYETEAFRRFNVNRGHMAAAGNYSSNESQKFQTFSFANVIPQNGYNNGGIWNTFERYARKLAVGPLCESVEVISGPIYLKDTPSGEVQGGKAHHQKLVVLKENGIPIPERLYKIIKCNSQEGKSYLAAFQFLNSETHDNARSLIQFKTPLGEVQRVTGLRFGTKGAELQQIDGKELRRTKRELDHDFYFGMMANSATISEMQDGYRRAREQKIEIDFKLLTEKIRAMASKEIPEIERETVMECQRLGKLLRLKRKLFQLYNREETRDLWEYKLEEVYGACVGKQEEGERQVLQRLRDEMGEDLLRLIK